MDSDDFDTNEFSEVTTKEILITYAKKIYLELTGKQIDFDMEIDDNGHLKIYNSIEQDGKLMINIVNTIKLRAKHLSEKEFDLEESQGSGSQFNRAARSYLTH